MGRRFDNVYMDFVPGRLNPAAENYLVRDNNRMYREDITRTDNPRAPAFAEGDGEITKFRKEIIYDANIRRDAPVGPGDDPRIHNIASEAATRPDRNKRMAEILRAEMPQIDRVLADDTKSKYQDISKRRKGRTRPGRTEITMRNARGNQPETEGHGLNNKLEQSVIGHSLKPMVTHKARGGEEHALPQEWNRLKRRHAGKMESRQLEPQLKDKFLSEPQMSPPLTHLKKVSRTYKPDRY